jgi:hypothetical protein
MGSGLTVTCGDTKEDAVECLELGGVFDDGDGGVFSGRVHLVEDVLGQGLSDSEYTVSAGALVLPWGLVKKTTVHTGRPWRHRQRPGCPSTQHRPIA